VDRRRLGPAAPSQVEDPALVGGCDGAELESGTRAGTLGSLEAVPVEDPAVGEDRGRDRGGDAPAGPAVLRGARRAAAGQAGLLERLAEAPQLSLGGGRGLGRSRRQGRDGGG